MIAAAERRSGESLWIRSHSPGVVRFLNCYLGQSLPIGIVVDDPAKLLPNEAFEGAETKEMRTHRYREQELREAKLVCANCHSMICGKAAGLKER